MKTTIITQTEEIINYDNIMKITMAEADVNGHELYVLVAYPVGVNVNEDDTDQLLQLGVFDDENKAVRVYDELIKFLENGVNTAFRIPIDIAEV